MKDPASIYTRRGTPIIVIISRLAFLAYFIFAVVAAVYSLFPNSLLNIYWIVYLIILYLVCEQIYDAFLKKSIDLTFAFPLLFAVFVLNLLSLIVRGQEEIPLMNRAEHFASFVLLTYIVWIFFLKYLPQKVWQDHPYYTALLTMSVVSLAGVGNEIVELFLDQAFQTQAVGPGYDTSIDLLMNTAGSGLFLAVQLILHEGKQSRN